MNILTNLKDSLARGLLREAERRIDKEGQMAKKKREQTKYQLQLNFFNSMEGAREIGKAETSPAPIKPSPTQRFVKAEKNLEWLGFFTPSTSRGAVKRVDEKVISFKTTVEGKKVKASATILPSAKYGLPDTADLDKYRAFQKILSDELIRSGKVPKHITFTSAEIIEAMGVSRKGKKSGKAYTGILHEQIRDWLRRMVLTGVEAEGAVWLAGKKVWATDTFHVFERAVAYGQELEDDMIADCHHVWLSDWQLENINELYLLSIDYDLHKQLRKPIAKSLLPILQIGFYASGGCYTKRYDELCQHLGIKVQKKFSYIKQQLEPSFKELHGKGFLENWNYGENKIHKTYNITWRAGDRFYEMQEVLQERERKLTEPVSKKPKRLTRPKRKSVESQHAEVKVETLPKTELVVKKGEPEPESKAQQVQSEPKEPPKVETVISTSEAQEPSKPEESDLVRRLVDLNVSKGVAEDLVKMCDHEVIKEWTDAIHYADAGDKAAFLVKAIKENWFVPDKYIVAKERAEFAKQLEQKKQAEQERLEKELERQKKEALRLDEIYNSLASDQQEEVNKAAEERLNPIVKSRIAQGEVDSPMVTAVLIVEKREVIKEWIETGKIEVDNS